MSKKVSKKIIMGSTYLKHLYQVFKFATREEFELRRARLFPTGNTEQENITTSIFLASLAAVKEYREELFLNLGINKIKTRNVSVHVYTELGDSKGDNRPDGLVVISSGKNDPVIEWAGFIETKVGNNEIDESQIERYVDFSRDIGINTIITISNQLVTSPTNSPVKTKKTKFELYHWSWPYLKVAATRLIRTNQVSDEDHVYILTELRRYFDAHRNLSHFNNMGEHWKESVNLIHGYEPNRKIDATTLNNIVSACIQEEKDIGLHLTDSSDLHIELIPTRKSREEEMQASLQAKKVITSDFYIDRNKNNRFSIDIDFIRRTVACYTNVVIEKGKAKSQTTALIRLLEGESGVSDDIKVNAFYLRKKCNERSASLSDLIGEREQGEYYSILEKDFGDEVKFFEIRLCRHLGKDFPATRNFITKLEATADVFLSQVMSNLIK